MSRHRPPSLLSRANRYTPAKFWGGIGTSAVLLLAAVAAGANSLGDDFTPAAHTTTSPKPVDDPGQRGRAGLPVPARIFPTLAPEDPQPWSEEDGPLHVTSAPLSAPQPVRRIPGTPTAVASIPDAPQPVAVEQQPVAEPAPIQAAQPPATDPDTQPDTPPETVEEPVEPEDVTDIPDDHWLICPDGMDCPISIEQEEATP